MALSHFHHPFDFEEIRVFDDRLDDMELLRKILSLEDLEDPFRVLNFGDVIKRHHRLMNGFPRVIPHYAVTCNPNPTTIRTLAALGTNFDCASTEEILAVMRHGVPCDRIILTNPVKTAYMIDYARKVGVSKLTADSIWELQKIRDLYPTAQVIIRSRSDVSPGQETLHLIRTCRDFNLDLHGFSLYPGNPCNEIMSMSRGLSTCKHLVEAARSFGCCNVQLIDIGGIPGFEIDEVFNHFSQLQRAFVMKDFLFDCRYLPLWFPHELRSNYHRHKTTTTTTEKSVHYKYRYAIEY